MRREFVWAPLSAYTEMNWIRATRPPISYRYHHLRRLDIDILEMDDIRNSLSKLKKGFKHRVGGKKRAPDRAGDNAVGEGVSSSAPLLRPDPRIGVSGHNRGGSTMSADASQAHSRDPSPHPDPVPADEGHVDDPQRKKVDAGWRRSNLDADVENAGSGLGQEVGQTSSPPPAISIPRKQEPNSTWTVSP